MAVDGRAGPDRRLDAPGQEGDRAEAPGVAAETRTRAEYYAALRAADPGRARADDGAGDRGSGWGAGDRGSGWEAPGIADHPDRPRPESLRLSPDRAAHILDGDAGGGGHRPGTGRPGKTEFPAEWSDEKITETILSVAQAPDQAEHQPSGRWKVTGIRDEVHISVVIKPDGQIWTAFPPPGSPGVIENPRNL